MSGMMSRVSSMVSGSSAPSRTTVSVMSVPLGPFMMSSASLSVMP